MSRYLFGKNSLLSEVSIQRSDGGGIRAYIYARENAKPGELDAVKNLLTASSMQWTPIFIAGKPALEIRGIGKDEIALLRLLHSKEAVVGSYEKKPNIGDVMSFWDKCKKNTLRISGLFYYAGDAGFLYYQCRQALENKKLSFSPGIVAGIFYALGSPIINIFGRGDKSDFQLKDIAHYTLQELKKQGITVSEDSAIRVVANGHNQGAFKKFFNFLERYPAEVCNSLFGVAGLMMIWAGIKDYLKIHKNGGAAKSKQAIFMDIGLGAMTVLAGLISVFVEEEVPDPDAPKKKGLARVWQYIKEKPLRAAGAALMISTLSHAGATSKDWKQSKAILGNRGNYSASQIKEAETLKSAVPGRALFAVTNLTAEGLMAVSSKGHGAGVKTDTSLDRSVYAVMADLVQRSPQINKDLLLGKISDFLADKKHLGGHPADIENGIRDQLAALGKNPWAGAVKTPLAETEAKQTRKTNWRERSAQPQPATPSLAPAMM